MQLVIASRFCGPPGSGNGGYACGRLAALLGGTVEVTLKAPPPLDRPLQVLQGPELWTLSDGATRVAEARPARLDLSPPDAPGLARAEHSSRHFAGLKHHEFPGCFVCGTQRGEGDGLRVFAGPLGHTGQVAAPWTAHPAFADSNGHVGPEILWAALDCPGFWSQQPALQDGEWALLGRMTARLDHPVNAGEPCTVVGWPLGREGRKLHCGTALFGADGQLKGLARQVWVVIRPALP